MPRFVCGSRPALERLARTPTRRRRRSPRSPARPGDPATAGSSPVSTSSSLTPRRAARSISRSTSSGSCRCGLCVANEQYLQWQLHVRESESVTLREKVTRRIRSPPYRCAILGRPGHSPSLLAGCGGVQARGEFGDVPIVLGDRPGADEAGVYLATARGYDDGRGRHAPRQRARATPTSGSSRRRPKGCIAVMAIVRPDQARAVRRRGHLQDERDEGAGGRAGAVARLHAGAARARRGGGRDGRRRCRVSTATSCQRELDEVAPTWTAGAPLLRRARRRPGPRPDRRGRRPQGRLTRLPRYWERMRRNSWRTDSGRPHIWVVSTRPSRTSRSTSSPAMPASSSSFSVPSTTSAAAACPNWCATLMMEVPVVVRVRLRVARHHQRRGVDVAVLLRRAGRARGRSSPTAARRESPGSLRQAA